MKIVDVWYLTGYKVLGCLFKDKASMKAWLIEAEKTQWGTCERLSEIEINKVIAGCWTVKAIYDPESDQYFELRPLNLMKTTPREALLKECKKYVP